VAAYEHVIIVTGYAETSLRYLNNGHFYDIPTDVFLNSWGVLGNQVVYHADPLPCPKRQPNRICDIRLKAI